MTLLRNHKEEASFACPLMQENGCPSAELFEHFLSANLPSDQMLVIEHHLGNCSACVSRLDHRYARVVPSDALIARRLRQQESESEPHDSAEIFLKRLKAQVPWSKPESIAHYRVLRLISSGGTGDVYDCLNENLQRRVAVKTIRPNMLSQRVVERFEKEAHIQAMLSHPNIVQVLDYGITDHDLPYLVMELVEGGTLRDLISRGPIAPLEAARFMETCARAIAYAHSLNVLHRDLKPSNILLDRVNEGEKRGGTGERVGEEWIARPGLNLKITDFGLARLFDGSGHITASGVVVGTPVYMSPEQASGGARNLSPESDIYSLGVILYESLTGHPPFESDQVGEVLRMIQESLPARPRSIVPGLSRDLETICLKCLEKEPTRRYRSGNELADDLRRYQAGEPILARPLGLLGKSYRWCERNRRLALSILTSSILLVMLIVVGVISILVRSNLIQEAEIETQKFQIAATRLRLEADQARTQFYNLAHAYRTVSGKLEDIEHSPEPKESIALLKREVDSNYAKVSKSFFDRIMASENPQGFELDREFLGAMALRDVGRPELAHQILQKLMRLTLNAKPTDPDYLKRAVICMQSATIIATTLEEKNQIEEAVGILMRARDLFGLERKYYDADPELARARFATDVYLQRYLKMLSRDKEAGELDHEINDMSQLVQEALIRESNQRKTQ